MKKLFLLSMVVLVCWGCSKDTVLEAPDMASSQSANKALYETINVMVNDMINHYSLECDSYIDYTDRYGTPVSFNIKDIREHYADGNYLEVQRGSSITFHLRLWNKNGSSGKIYCAIRYEPWGCDGPWVNFSDYGLATGELTIPNIQNEGMQFGIWASDEDFSNGELDSGQTGGGSCLP